MLIKKLLVPLINNKILLQAEYCYIASASISEPAFDLLMSKLSSKCQVDIVTGLDLTSDPKVLKKILTQYPGRVTLRIYTKNFFHPNIYIFDLPFRKRTAFVSSGNFTLGGLKDNEELSYKIDTEKEVEEIKSSFRMYFEQSQDLTEKIISEYEMIYTSFRQREIASKEEKKQFTNLLIGRFNWDSINFTKQYFQREDYLTFENTKAHLTTPLVHTQRVQVQNRLLDLYEALKSDLAKLKINPHYDLTQMVSSLNPMGFPEHKVKGMWLAFGRSKFELKNYEAQPSDLINLQVIIRSQELGIWLMVGKQNSAKEDREYFRLEMKKEEYRKKFYDLLKGLGKNYWIEIAGERREADSFDNEDALWYFTNSDQLPYSFIIGRTYLPGVPEISSAEIIATIKDEFNKLIPLYKLMKDKSFEK